MIDEWPKVLSAVSVILAAPEDHVLDAINALPADQRTAARNLFRSGAIALNRMKKGVE